MSNQDGTRRRGLRMLALPLALGLTLGTLAACGDDDDTMGTDPMMQPPVEQAPMDAPAPAPAPAPTDTPM